MNMCTLMPIFLPILSLLIGPFSSPFLLGILPSLLYSFTSIQLVLPISLSPPVYSLHFPFSLPYHSPIFILCKEDPFIIRHSAISESDLPFLSSFHSIRRKWQQLEYSRPQSISHETVYLSYKWVSPSSPLAPPPLHHSFTAPSITHSSRRCHLSSMVYSFSPFLLHSSMSRQSRSIIITHHSLSIFLSLTFDLYISIYVFSLVSNWSKSNILIDLLTFSVVWSFCMFSIFVN